MALSTNHTNLFCAREFLNKLYSSSLEEDPWDTDKLQQILDLGKEDFNIPANAPLQQKVLAVIRMRESLISQNAVDTQKIGRKRPERAITARDERRDCLKHL